MAMCQPCYIHFIYFSKQGNGGSEEYSYLPKVSGLAAKKAAEPGIKPGSGRARICTLNLSLIYFSNDTLGPECEGY